jgi:hypothetical protein
VCLEIAALHGLNLESLMRVVRVEAGHLYTTIVITAADLQLQVEDLQQLMMKVEPLAYKSE